MAISRSAAPRPGAARTTPAQSRPQAQEPARSAPPIRAKLPALGPRFDQIIDAANRLPRPVLMILTVGLFAYASFDPEGFAARMQALSEVPEPLWWMQGAVVTFYFGAREAHYHRQGKAASKAGKPAESP